MTHETITGPIPAALSNAISHAIHAALERGMEIDEACSVTIGVAGDYWLHGYPMDEDAIKGLSDILRDRSARASLAVKEGG